MNNMQGPNLFAQSVVAKRSGNRCQWFYPDRSRCINTRSLQFHHTTYDNFGHENPNDLVHLCPAHHHLADIIRRDQIGIPQAIADERTAAVVNAKLRNIPDQLNAQKFIARLRREEELFAEAMLRACEGADIVIRSIREGRGNEYYSTAVIPPDPGILDEYERSAYWMGMITLAMSGEGKGFYFWAEISAGLSMLKYLSDHH